MKMTGEQRIAAPRERVWEALNDPDILRQCIPGCQSLDRHADDRMSAVVEIKIGPIGARFKGAVTLSDLDPPNGYTISGEGQGGTVGFAKGGAKVRLAKDGDGTLLSYDVDAQVGGRLAQLGGPIIDVTAKQLAGKFFEKFGALVGGAPVTATKSVAAPTATPSAPLTYAAPALRGLPVAWMLAVVVGALAGYLVGHASGGTAGSEWIGLSVGLLVIVVAAAAFEYGRRAGAPDPALIAAVVRAAREQG
jgi:carbon monoxide dehydrogenase subunit G